MLQAKSKNNKTYKNMVAVSNLYQLVNYTNCEKLWQIAFINNGQLGIFNG